MSHFLPLALAAGLGTLACLPALAQPAVPSHTLRALDAKAPVPPQRHAPVLARAASSPAPATPWREANQTVDRIGGWKAYAREAAASSLGPKP